jgi:hypothetical protein
MEDRVCDHCGCWVESNETLYQMQVSIFASPTMDLDLSETSENLRNKYNNLVKSMENMSHDQVEEAEEQVYESYQYALCAECRELIHRRLKNRSKILGD